VKVPVAVLVSGRGSNLQALLDAAASPDFPATIVKVVSNVPGALALERAAAAGVPTATVVSKGRPRVDFEAEVLEVIGGVQWVCLAGFMRVLTDGFLARFPSRVLNVHPSLLPAFGGAHGIADTLAYGATVAGATVHLVDAGVDSGPVLCQGTAPVFDDDTEASLAARVLALEHRLYPAALRWCAEGRVRVEGRRAFVDLREGERRWLAWEP
jgi:phosphoribosylglycinamide formyltransferase-1